MDYGDLYRLEHATHQTTKEAAARTEKRLEQRAAALEAALLEALQHYSLLFSTWPEEQRRGHEIIVRRLRAVACPQTPDSSVAAMPMATERVSR